MKTRYLVTNTFYDREKDKWSVAPNLSYPMKKNVIDYVNDFSYYSFFERYK